MSALASLVGSRPQDGGLALGLVGPPPQYASAWEYLGGCCLGPAAQVSVVGLYVPVLLISTTSDTHRHAPTVTSTHTAAIHMQTQ